MDITMTAAVPTRLTLEGKLLLACVAYFIALKLVFSFAAFPSGDEAYYWMWGRHLSLSYFDHPPLQGWLQGLTYGFLGASPFAVRFPALLAFAGELYIFFLVARRLAGEAWRPVFLRSAVVFLASPLFGFFGTVAFNDYLLVLLVMSSGYFFICFFTDVEEGKPGRSLDLFVAAALLGLATLAKYNGAFLGLAVAGMVLTRPRLRRLLLDWRLYAAALIAVALQAPVLVWNAQEGFASFRFQLGSRHGDVGFTGFSISGMKAFVGEALLLVSPFLIPFIIRFFWARQRNPYERAGKTLAIWCFWLSTLACLLVANFSWVLWWWNIVAFVLIFPFVGRYTKPIMLAVHTAYGAAVSTFLVVSYSIVPVLLLFGIDQAMETDTMYGWPEVAAVVEAAQDEHNADFLAANFYQNASQLAFALDNPDVVALSVRRDAFDDWFDPQTRIGQNAIFLEDPTEQTDYWRGHFESVRQIGEAPASVAGHVLKGYRVYLAEGFRPLPDADAALPPGGSQ
jgi:4-amino-4-deoxy-L-arabinose transferase-like glycosyltransferase